MIIYHILSEENYSNGFHLDHIQMFIEDIIEVCAKGDGQNPIPLSSIKASTVDCHGTDVLVIYTGKLNKKELMERIEEED